MSRAKWPRICSACGGLNAARFTACVHCATELPSRRASDARYSNRKRAERRAAAKAERADRAKPVILAAAILRACANGQD